MEFWGVEVKVGQSVKVDPMDELDGYIHISQVALGEAKKDKASEPVVLYLKIDNQKLVLGTLSKDDIPQLSLDLVLDKEAELSHSSKSASVYFVGYKVIAEDGNMSDISDSDDDDVELMGQENGKPEIKAEDGKVNKTKKPVPVTVELAKQVKIADPKKDEEDDSDDESDDESADDDELGSSDEMDEDGDSDEESESDEEDEETPVKKVSQGKKRPNESASKTPVSAKKAKNATPEKTDGKKNVHTATPHPMKKGAKTPNSGGQLFCKSCSKPFNSESGLQQHKKVKHGGQ